MYPTASAGPDQPTYVTDPAQLPVLLQQLSADLVDPAITYLLGGHYYDRTNHPRYFGTFPPCLPCGKARFGTWR